MGSWFALPNETVGVYNSWDTFATARLWQELKVEMESNGQLSFFEKDWWPLVPAVVRMSMRGLEVDQSALAAYSKSIHGELAECDRVIRAHYLNTAKLDDVQEFLITRAADISTGKRKKHRKLMTKAEGAWLANRVLLNIDSDEQVGKWLFEDLQLKCFKFTEKKKLPSVDQDSLNRTLKKFRKKDELHRVALETLFHRSRLNTIRERYLDFGTTPGNPFVYPRVKMYRAETGRLAYADPPLQQWPDESRGVFIAGDGMVFLALDYKQLEARILAYLAKDDASITVFDAGKDIHKANVLDLLGWEDAEWDALDPTPRTAARNFAKTFLYGISYGGEAETLKTKLYCPCPKCIDASPPVMKLKRAELASAANRWNAIHRPILDFREQLVKDVIHSGRNYYTTPFGRKRFFSTPWPTVRTELYNFPMQATASGLVDRATIECDKVGVPLVLQMHDELMARIPEKEIPKWASLMQRIMEEKVPEMNGVVFPVDIAVGKNWKDMKEITV